jgi:hypothetical protein
MPGSLEDEILKVREQENASERAQQAKERATKVSVWKGC